MCSASIRGLNSGKPNLSRVPVRAAPRLEINDRLSSHLGPKSHLLLALLRPFRLDLHCSFDTRLVVAKAGPMPVLGLCYQPARNRLPPQRTKFVCRRPRVAMHVPQLLDALPLCPHIEIMVPRHGPAKAVPLLHNLILMTNQELAAVAAKSFHTPHRCLQRPSPNWR